MPAWIEKWDAWDERLVEGKPPPSAYVGFTVEAIDGYPAGGIDR
jgi:hypothetical protein